MCQLFETIKVKNGILENIDYHNSRVNKSRNELFGDNKTWNLRSMITLPPLASSKTYRCKFVYNEVFKSVEFIPYTIKPLKTLQLVEVSNIDYGHKYLDRSVFDNIKLLNPHAADVIIVNNGNITDCTYANLVFFDGEKWITPSTPLLRGTKRQRYIDEQIVVERVIKPADLKHFYKMKIINAMIDLDESPEIDIENIVVSSEYRVLSNE